MKYFCIFFIISLSSCVIESSDLTNDVKCTPEAFVGVWEYQSTGNIVKDSVPDIVITLSDDPTRDIQINSTYHYVKAVGNCTSGDLSGLLDVTYELVNADELHRRNSVFIFFGSVDIYKRK